MSDSYKIIGQATTAPLAGGTSTVDEKIMEEISERVAERVSGKVIEQKLHKSTEIMAIFITLFTFISVNVNIFSQIESLGAAVWFMILMATASIVLIATIFFLIDESTEKNKNRYFFVFLAAGFVFLVCFLSSFVFGNRSLKTSSDNTEVFLGEILK